MNITIKSDKVLPEIVNDFAFGRIKNFINKHLDSKANKIFKKHGYAFVIHKTKTGVSCTVRELGVGLAVNRP